MREAVATVCGCNGMARGDRVYLRGKTYWCRLRAPDGKWFSKSTGYKVGQEDNVN